LAGDGKESFVFEVGNQEKGDGARMGVTERIKGGGGERRVFYFL
jgi:hypothetical protein